MRFPQGAETAAGAAGGEKRCAGIVPICGWDIELAESGGGSLMRRKTGSGEGRMKYSLNVGSRWWW